MDNMEQKYFFTRGKAILLGLVLLSILIIIITIKLGKQNSIKEYKDFEEELKNAAENYVIINNVILDEGEEIRVTKSKLIENNLIYNDLKDKCSAYVLVSNEEDIATEEYTIVYRAYIKCGKKYITSNYSEY